MVELGKRSIGNFLEHRMPTYAEQLSYRGLFGLFPFIILVFALLAVLQLDAVFDRLIEAAMGAPPQQTPEPLEPVAKEGRAQVEFLRPLIEQRACHQKLRARCAKLAFIGRRSGRGYCRPIGPSLARYDR
jgi:hypothetical protein